MIDDGNVDDSNIDFCIECCKTRGLPGCKKDFYADLSDEEIADTLAFLQFLKEKPLEARKRWWGFC